MRFIGLDVHRDFCDVAIYEDGEARSAGRVASSPQELAQFAQSLQRDDRVGLETTGNALSIARILEPHCAGVLVADTRNVRAMTHAKVKNDRIDARLLAKLLAAGMLPGTWVCDEQTRALRRRIQRRTQLVRGRTRARNQVHAIVIRNLARRPPASTPFTRRGRAWLAELELPADERETLEGCLREADFLSGEVELIDQEIARYALGCPQARRLMTIPGVDVTTAVTLLATIGDITRFQSPRQLVGYVGLDPRSRQSGVSPVYSGRISKQGSSQARHVLCEAAHATMRAPGPLRAFGQRVGAPARQQDRDRRRRAQARLSHLAAADQTAGLPLRTPRSHLPQATQARARDRRRTPLQPGRPPRPRNTRHPRPMGRRTRPRATDRSRLPCHRRQLEAAKTENSNDTHLITSVRQSSCMPAA